MFRTILIATDLSRASEELCKCAGFLRHVGPREVWLVHVCNVREAGGLAESFREEHEVELVRQVGILKRHGLNAEGVIREGIPFVEINREAARKKARVIMVGSHGEGLLKEMLLGSTAFEVIRQGTHPVLVFRQEVIEREGDRRCRMRCREPFKHVLFATDFSKNAAHAQRFVDHICREAKSRVTLVHVQEEARIAPHLTARLPEFNRIDRARLAKIAAALTKRGARKVDAAIPYGHAVQEILRVERWAKPTLIVLGSQGRSWTKELFLGSVAHNVVRHAKAPVLIVPWSPARV
jgi:nucleotide-binding universal stress UspA family protein